MRTMKPLARFLVLLTLVFVFACGTKVTRENFDKIKTGMTVDEVHSILGSPDDTQSAGVQGIASGSVEVWKDGDKSITVTFMNDKVATALQSNL